MPPLPVLNLRPRAGAPILPVLLLTLLLAAVLAYQAHDAARSHRRTSEAALRDYAAFAAWELGRTVEAELTSALSGATLRARFPIELGGEATAGAGLESFARGLRQGLARCGCDGAAHDFFFLDLRGGTAELRAERLLPAHEAWLRDELLPRVARDAEAAALRHEVQEVQEVVVRETRVLRRKGAHRSAVRVMTTPMAPYEVVRGPGGSGPVLYALLADAAGRPTRAYGFWLDAPGLVGPVLRHVLNGTPLLPPSLLRGASNQEALALSVTVNGEALLEGAAGDALASIGATDTLSTVLGEMMIRAAVRPEMAGRLVIGGLPRSRLPLLLGAFVLTLGLVGIAVLQIRRQQELMRLRSDFISGVSHELRTPLAQIRLFSDLLGSGRLSQAQRSRSVRVIGEEARRLTYLVENILHFSRSERRGSRIAPVPVEVAPLLREIADSFAPLAHSRRVSLEVQAEPGIVATLDRDALRQVLLNLLDNAVKYGPPEQTVTVGVEQVGDRVRIRVDDQGPGVPAAERERVWEPYRRLEREAEAATGGSGIGLAVVRELVALHGGRASVTDRPGGGARFVVELPGAGHANGHVAGAAVLA